MSKSSNSRMTLRVDDIDWTRWTPKEVATLLFVIRDQRILMITKKRGLGAGNINGPGGQVEPGESPLDGAIREVREELEVSPIGVQSAGDLQFQFVDGFSIMVHVFTATDCRGEPTETDEAAPLWVDVDLVPYDQMGSCDWLWIPFMLAGRRFRGRFLFDGDTLVDHQVTALT